MSDIVLRVRAQSELYMMISYLAYLGDLAPNTLLRQLVVAEYAKQRKCEKMALGKEIETDE